jgi:dihydroorotate dehydrogenase
LEDPSLQREVFGLKFSNPVGLAAGFDKNAKLVRSLYRLGFGHVEVGTVTPLPQSGNPKPRMFRIWDAQALINRMGFNNDGAVVIARRIAKLRASKAQLPIIGVNIGKNRDTSVENAASDYQTCAELFAPLADYLVINVSSPNTPGLRDLQQVEALEPILAAVMAQAGNCPVLVKIAPDLADQDIKAIAKLTEKLKLSGIIATNTTLNRQAVEHLKHANEAGGLSGKPLANRSLEILRLLRSELKASTVVISVGGVTTASEFQQRLEVGADLVQSYTGFIYGGPNWPRKVQR